MSAQQLLNDYNDYIRFERNLSSNTMEAYMRDAARFLSWVADNGMHAEHITLDDLHRFTSELMDMGISLRSIGRILSSIRSLYTFMLAEERIKDNPTELLESPKIGEHLPEVLSVEEIEAIESTLDLSLPEERRDFAIIETLYSCGLRVSELCQLCLSDIFLDEQYIRIRGKGDKQRLIPISDHLITVLQNWLIDRNEINIRPGEEDYLFVSARRGRHISRITVFHNIKLYAERAGIVRNISPHTFRHTFATHLLEGGANLRAIQVMLGHESIGTTEIYTHIDRTYLREQVQMYFPRNQSEGERT